MSNYQKTKRACYMGFITQAIAANFAPLLFLKFHNDYQIALGKIALISTCFFLTQLLVDLFCAKFVDKIGYRICIVISEVCSAAGLVGLAFLPDLLPEPLVGIILSVIVYAVGSGLIEVLCSPIVEACPFDNKEATMSLLHSFYCWGAVGTIVISTLFFAVFGMDSWKWLAVLWALVPAINIYNFATCPIEHLVDEGEGMGIKELFRKPLFWISICLMICSGASELAMAQWASAYAEAALGLSKTVGDLAGPCMFAVTMGISRIIFGKYGDKIDLMKFMIGSGFLCVICYLLASVSSNPISGLIGCIIFCWDYVARHNQYFIRKISGRWNGYVCFACYGGGSGWKHRSGDCWTCYTKCRRQYSCRYGSWTFVPGYFINHAFYFCKAKISFNKVYGGYDG